MILGNKLYMDAICLVRLGILPLPLRRPILMKHRKEMRCMIVHVSCVYHYRYPCFNIYRGAEDGIATGDTLSDEVHTW